MVDIDLWAQKLSHYLQHHLDTEKEALSFYRHLAEDAGSDRVRLLVGVVRDDAIRQHRIFEKMLEWVRTEHSQSRRPDPELGFESARPNDTEHLLEHTRKLIELQREDEERLKELSHLVAQVADTRWWSVLIDAIGRDTTKHVMLLQAVEEILSE